MENSSLLWIIWVIWDPDKVLELHHYLSLPSPVELPQQGQEFLVAADSSNIQGSVLHRKDVHHAEKHLLFFLTLQNQWHFYGFMLLNCWIPGKFGNFTEISDTMVSSCDGQGRSSLKAKHMWLLWMVMGTLLASNRLLHYNQRSLSKWYFFRVSTFLPRILLADTLVGSWWSSILLLGFWLVPSLSPSRRHPFGMKEKVGKIENGHRRSIKFSFACCWTGTLAGNRISGKAISPIARLHS